MPGDLVGMLSSAGWTPGRRVDVTGVAATLRAAGFEVPRAATEFLSQFAYLHVQHEPHIELHGEPAHCWTRFDPTAVATPRDADVARRCAETAGEALCPIGTDGFHLTLYITPGATFYAGRDASVYRYAPDQAELLRMMRDGRRPHLIGEWTPD
ncbi:SUKH-3 domain-containing protein [Paractinoplanes deccanensis]|nr:SUKH-3 domain-containing protein [Actinoplanes deccanensis]